MLFVNCHVTSVPLPAVVLEYVRVDVESGHRYRFGVHLVFPVHLIIVDDIAVVAFGEREVPVGSAGNTGKHSAWRNGDRAAG